MKHFFWNWNKLYWVWLSRGHMMQHLEVYLILCACLYHPPILYWGNFHQHWHWEIYWPFNQILSEVTLLAALRLDDGQIFVPMRWRGSFFLSDAYNKLNIQPFLAISAEYFITNATRCKVSKVRIEFYQKEDLNANRLPDSGKTQLILIVASFKPFCRKISNREKYTWPHCFAEVW